jgi:microcystin-dependent protein
MSEPYVGEIRLVGFNFAPVGWFLCQGQTLSISQYETLFQLIGTTYGGDGQSTFQLPNLGGRTPVHTGGPNSYILGQAGGLENVTLTTATLPGHVHPIVVQGASGNVSSPVGAVLAGSTAGQYASTDTNNTSGIVLNPVGGGLPHNNLQPLLCLSYIIAWAGVFPSQS